MKIDEPEIAKKLVDRIHSVLVNHSSSGVKTSFMFDPVTIPSQPTISEFGFKLLLNLESKNLLWTFL
jgi:hypothetical protein